LSAQVQGVADLHTHTRYSDGKLPPAEVVEMAAARGIEALAITDHETAAGIPEAIEAGREYGLEIIPGIELAGRMKAFEVHVLGLWIDPENAALRHAVRRLSRERWERAERMVEKLRAVDIDITMDDILAVAGKGAPARPHVAQALYNIGAAASYEDAFKTLIGRDMAGYVARKCLSPRQAIEMVHQAGGAAVLAHGLIGGPGPDEVAMVADMGLDGIETRHPRLSAGQSAWLAGFAKERGLVQTAGSDWHGEGWSEGEMGDYLVDRDTVESLRRLRPAG